MKPLDPRLLRYAPAARVYVAASALIAVAQTAVTIAFAWFLADALTGLIAGRDVRTSLLWLVATILVRGVLIWASEAWGLRAAAQTGAQLRAALLRAIGRRGPGWLAQRNQAELAVTAGHGLDALDPYFARYIPQLVLTMIATPVIVAVMWWQDWPSGVAAIITLPLIPLFLILIGIATRSVQRRQLGVLQQLAARFADTVQGLATLRVFGRERRAVTRMRETAEQYRRETMGVLRYSFISGFALELLSSLAVAIIAVSVGFRLLDRDITLEVGLFVLLLAPEAFLPLRQVGVQFHAAAEGVAATEQIFEVLDGDSPRTGTQVAAEQRTTSRAAAGATLVLDDVSVRYGDRALPPVSLTAEAGTVTLIEGPSGSGKSSLFAALRGAADFDGSATVGEADVRALAPSDWMAWAGQRPGLIRGTVAENVALGQQPDAARVSRALAAAQADTIDPTLALGAQGSGLSGGQAQRVAVARALYRLDDGVQVLALDEPSSALDAETEEALWRSIRAVADSGVAVLLISHRRSARDIADRIVSVGVSA
ncbi:thiol reductant ABC exporter subunit CydD [Microbacterium keratanolyticum]|uniref:thiol reductant ABC exporter subunit CydD n=1 Tax=Microbacterium keratanolyticum TaxID=67574 RepID=UPI00366E1129